MANFTSEPPKNLKEYRMIVDSDEFKAHQADWKKTYEQLRDWQLKEYGMIPQFVEKIENVDRILSRGLLTFEEAWMKLNELEVELSRA